MIDYSKRKKYEYKQLKSNFYNDDFNRTPINLIVNRILNFFYLTRKEKLNTDIMNYTTWNFILLSFLPIKLIQAA